MYIININININISAEERITLIQGVYKILRQDSRMSSSHENKEENFL
jgi:hypothetical protein